MLKEANSHQENVPALPDRNPLGKCQFVYLKLELPCQERKDLLHRPERLEFFIPSMTKIGKLYSEVACQA